MPKPALSKKPRACDRCAATYTPRRGWQRFCSTKCRMNHWTEQTQKAREAWALRIEEEAEAEALANIPAKN